MTPDHATLLGRALLCSVFLRSLYVKLTSFEAQVDYMASRGMPGGALGGLLLVGAIVMITLGSLALLTGYRARTGAWLLIAFLVPTTLIFHHDLSQRMEWIQATKNLSLIGGLLMVVAHGPGRWRLGDGRA